MKLMESEKKVKKYLSTSTTGVRLGQSRLDNKFFLELNV